MTLKSGTVFDLDRFEASDIDDGVRVWDGRRGVVDLDSLRIRTIELLPTLAIGAAPTGCTARCIRGRATSRASFSGTGRSASAPTRSTATSADGRSSACVSTRSARSRVARMTAAW